MKDVTYGSFSCDVKPNKTETHLTQLTAGGDRINYPEDVSTPTADMTLVKVMLNSVISTKGSNCVRLDVKDFYLNLYLKRFKCCLVSVCPVSVRCLSVCKEFLLK